MKSALQKAREAPGSTKARFLGAAEEVFAARGYEGASTRDIAARAGVNISSLHYHWESKETLYYAVFRNIYNQLIEIFNAIPAFLSSLRLTRRKFWIPGEDEPVPGVPDAYEVAAASIDALRGELGKL